MKIINEEQVNPCLTSIEVEIEKAEFEPSVNAAYKEAAKSINVPGFRKGKAPRMILKQYVDNKYLAEYAAEKFVDKNFKEIMDMSGKEPFAQVSFDVVDCDVESDGPITLKFNIPTEPIVKLGEYKGVEVKKFFKNVEDKDIDKQIDEMLMQRSKIVPVLDRAVEMDDNCFIDLKEKDSEEAPKPERYIVGKGTDDMDKAIIGMTQGDEKDVTVNFPDDYFDKELANTTKEYHIKVRNIYSMDKPEFNDEFVADMFKSAPEGQEKPATVEEFKAFAKKNLQENYNKQFEDQFKNSLLDTIVANATIDYPEQIIDQRVKDSFDRFSNYLKSQNMKVEDYMKMYQLTPDMLIKDFKKREEIELKRSLVGAEIIKAENIEASDEEFETALKEKAEARKSTVEAFKEMVDKNEYFKNMIKDEIISKKFMDFIESNAKIVEEEFDEEKAMAEQMAKQIEETVETEDKAE